MAELNDDDIIAQGLLSIREGIVSGNWDKVIEGYNSISGEELVSPEQKKEEKSRIEYIRDKINKSKVIKDRPIEIPESKDYNKLTKKDLEKILKDSGYTTKDLKNKKKAELVSLAEKGLKTDVQEDDISSKDINSSTQKGGNRFGKGEVSIISDAYDPTIAKRNAALAKGKVKVNVKKRDNMPKDNSSDEKAPFRFYNKNTPPSRG